MSNGWVKLHRKILDNDIFRHDRTAWHVFQVLLVLADSKTGKWSGGLFQLTELCGDKKDTVYKAILRLESQGMINRGVNSRYTVYNISKWGDYQSDGKQPVNSEYTPSKRPVKLLQEVEVEVDNTKVLEKQVYGNPIINEMVALFENDGIKLKNIAKQRQAAHRLIKRAGENKAVGIVRAAIAAQSDKFAPTIGDLVTLDNKLSDLVSYYKKIKGKEVLSV